MTTVLVVLLVLVGLALVVGIAFYAVGREVVLLEQRVAPSVYELEEAIAFIADRLPDDVAARISHDDVRWVLRVDAEELEAATAEEVADGDEDEVVDPDGAVGRVLARVADERPELADEDVVAVLDTRFEYLRAIGAVGDEA
ncbi:hypothetical protein HC251_07610 [Iamia sp. SCSIO 61187]|uniref:hypothetical protein n=1 Tax=Iamia sp. SCSIO 61187 TaxID=2722752 RepID=UPI001C6316AD|nr:hypothetical protein [Iamia sp. SCSIO 61187]QYG92319.1 hypothetical protein HC251_07610 [Iamia sp. SCSIO 61187]